MNARDVYKIVKALPNSEQRKLLDIMVNEMDEEYKSIIKMNPNKKPLMTRQEADAYIWKYVFSKVK